MKSPFAARLCFVVSLLAGCAREITGPDQSTPSCSIVASATAIRTYGVVQFTLSASGAPVDSVTMEFGDNVRVVFRCGGKSDVSITTGHQYIWKGRIAATMTAHSGKKYSRASQPIDIAVDSPPVVRALSIDLAEGDSVVVQCRDLIRDEENDPFEYTLSVSDPRLLLIRRGDSLTLKGADPDYNGNARLTVSYTYVMSDSLPRQGFQEIWIFVNPRDRISGLVEDIMVHTEAGTRDPSLVMSPPYTAGWVRIDGNSVPVDLATGAFRSPRLPAGISHTVSWGGFATAAGDSSFVTSSVFPPGDREVTLKMHSAAGTGMSRADLRDFYREANFRLKVNGREGLHGTEYTRAGGLLDYLSSQDAGIEGHALRGLTPEQQDLLAGWVEEEFNPCLPPEYRIPLVRGTAADSLPVVERNGAPVPAPGTALVFLEETPGWVTPPQVFTRGFVIEGAWIWLRDEGSSGIQGISRAATLGAFLARRAAPSGLVTGSRFGGKSSLAIDGSGPADHLTGADRKLLWLPLLLPLGTPLNDFCRLY